tara:strand:- start:324 stop:776 length:453 start_codon:yes stop_codon:yes gene_type:complete
MTEKITLDTNIDIRIIKFVEVFFEEIFGLNEIRHCCFDKKSLTVKYHLSEGGCGIGDLKCYQLDVRTRKHSSKPIAEDRKHDWLIVELGDRMWCVLKMREEDTNIISQFDKLVPETLKDAWREASIRRGTYLKKPYVVGVNLVSVEKNIA